MISFIPFLTQEGNLYTKIREGVENSWFDLSFFRKLNSDFLLVGISVVRNYSPHIWRPMSKYAPLNPICHLLAVLGAHHILHVSRIRVKSHLSFAGIIRSSPYSPR